MMRKTYAYRAKYVDHKGENSAIYGKVRSDDLDSAVIAAIGMCNKHGTYTDNSLEIFNDDTRKWERE